MEAFYQSVKPIHLVNCTLEIAAPGKIPAGKTEIPFEFLLAPRTNKTLYETYHGVFVNVQYHLRAEMKRSFLAKDLTKMCEFIVEYHPDKCEKAIPHPVAFTITPDSLQNVRERNNIPRFLVKGKFDSTMCSVTKPFTGELVLEFCEMPIKSVELQLVRVETCGCAEGYARDGTVFFLFFLIFAELLLNILTFLFFFFLATEIQNIQIGEGDIPSGLAIPVYMIFPRLFTCPTLATSNFKVGM